MALRCLQWLCIVRIERNSTQIVVDFGSHVTYDLVGGVGFAGAAGIYDGDG
jgi:hypothetical protein